MILFFYGLGRDGSVELRLAATDPVVVASETIRVDWGVVRRKRLRGATIALRSKNGPAGMKIVERRFFPSTRPIEPSPAIRLRFVAC